MRTPTRIIAGELHTTDELVAAYDRLDLDAGGDTLRHELESAIPAAIDAVYAVRDAGGNMHEAGAAAAYVAVLAAREAVKHPPGHRVRVDLETGAPA